LADKELQFLTISQGPICIHPMPLIIPGDSDDKNQMLSCKASESANQQCRDNTVSKGKGKQVKAKLECSELFDHVCVCCDFSMCHNSTTKKIQPCLFTQAVVTILTSLHNLENRNHDFHGPKVDDDSYVTDTYSVDDDDSVKLSLKAPSKFLESLAIEVS
jgi:hypothetical protein